MNLLCSKELRMQSAIKKTLLALALIGSAGAAMQATGADARVRYKWRDAGGNLHFSDSLPPEAVKFGYEMVNAQGVVVRRVDRLKTDEELATAKAEADRVAEEKRKADDISRNDAQMLAAYPSEEDLRKSLQAQIDLIAQNIQATEVGLASQEKSLAERLVHAAEQERTGKPVPVAVTKQIETLKKGIADQKAFLARRTADRATMEKQLVADIEHYRNLKARQEALRKGGR
jgi:hypothetical protein